MDPMPFKDREAPCGKVMHGERFQDRDAEALLTDQQRYACGCRIIRHEYHDGTVSCKTIHHNGKVLVDEIHGAE